MKITVTPGQSTMAAFGRVAAGKMILAGDLTSAETKAVAGLFATWKPGEEVKKKDLRRHGADLYECIQAHTTQADWAPDATPALWEIKSA